MLVRQYREVNAGTPLYEIDSPEWKNIQQELVNAEAEITTAAAEVEVALTTKTETEKAAESLAEAIRSTLVRKGITILGPAPGVFPRINDRYRVQLLIKGTLNKNEKNWLVECLTSFRLGFRAVDVLHDVDPLVLY